MLLELTVLTTQKFAVQTDKLDAATLVAVQATSVAKDTAVPPAAGVEATVAVRRYAHVGRATAASQAKCVASTHLRSTVVRQE